MAAGPSRADRIRGAIIGQFVGDALCLGSHWHYNFVERARLYPDGINGFEAPVPGHYHAGRQPGDPTHYGDAALVLLRSVVEAGGLDPLDYGRRFVALFADPAYAGYRDKPTQITVQHWRDFTQARPESAYGFQDGADDQQTVTMSRLAPVVCRHADDPALELMVERAVRVCQNNDRTVAFHQLAGRILRSALAGTALPEAVAQEVAATLGAVGEEAARMLADARATQSLSAPDAAGEFGRACYLSSTFPCMLHAALKHADDLEAGLVETVRAGGDNASRAAVLGGWLGAMHGIGAIPAAWRGRLKDGPEITALTERLVAQLGV